MNDAEWAYVLSGGGGGGNSFSPPEGGGSHVWGGGGQTWIPKTWSSVDVNFDLDLAKRLEVALARIKELEEEIEWLKDIRREL